MKRYKNDDDRPYFKRGEPVEVTRDFIENIGDPDFPRYGWIVKKSRPLMSDPGYEYLIERDPEFAADDGYDETYWVNNDQIKGGDFRYNEGTYWPTPENETMESRKKLAKEAGRKVISAANGCSIHDMGDCWIVTNKDGLNIGQCKTLIEAEHIAENADEYTAKKLGYAESKKLVKEGAGAGYTVTIKNAKLDNVKVKKIGGGDWEFEADIVKDNYMVEAADYYNLFCPMDSEFGGEEWVEVAGKVRGVCWWYDEDYEVEQEISGTKQDISFMYGHGWVHANLPEDGHIVSDHMESDGHDTWQIESIELDAPQLAECVNYCHEHFLDEDEPEEDGEHVNEVSGWDLEDEDLTLVNSESDGDKLYIVKLWWGSGYMLDCYNAYAFSAEEALNYVVAYIEKTDPESLEAIDENANDYLQELVDEGEAASLEEAYENPYFQETYLWVDATREGAEQGHYIYNENLAIAQYPDKHNHPLAKGVDRSRFNENSKDIGLKREVFTIEVSYVDENGDNQMIEAMKYAKTYYTYEEALTAAKEAYLEYAEICEEPVEVMVMGGEYEMPSGDIYGEPDVIEVITADTIDSLVV